MTKKFQNSCSKPPTAAYKKNILKKIYIVKSFLMQRINCPCSLNYLKSENEEHLGRKSRLLHCNRLCFLNFHNYTLVFTFLVDSYCIRLIIQELQYRNQSCLKTKVRNSKQSLLEHIEGLSNPKIKINQNQCGSMKA